MYLFTTVVTGNNAQSIVVGNVVGKSNMYIIIYQFWYDHVLFVLLSWHYGFTLAIATMSASLSIIYIYAISFVGLKLKYLRSYFHLFVIIIRPY